MLLRNEQAKDIKQIHNIQYVAFKDHPIHQNGIDPVEHLIVERLRKANALTLSIVAEEEGKPVGHIAMSPAIVGKTTHGWYLLGPVGVIPQFQNKGIGSALIRETLNRMKAIGAKGIVLVGNPTFYKRFGFKNIPGITYEGIPGYFILYTPFTNKKTEGGIIAHKAFYPAD